MKKGKIADQYVLDAHEALMRHRQYERRYLTLLMMWEPGDYTMESRIDKAKRQSDYWLEKYESYIN